MSQQDPGRDLLFRTEIQILQMAFDVAPASWWTQKENCIDRVEVTRFSFAIDNSQRRLSRLRWTPYRACKRIDFSITSSTTAVKQIINAGSIPCAI